MSGPIEKAWFKWEAIVKDRPGFNHVAERQAFYAGAVYALQELDDCLTKRALVDEIGQWSVDEVERLKFMRQTAE